MTFTTRIAEYGEKPWEPPPIEAYKPTQVEQLRDMVPKPEATGSIGYYDDIHHLFKDTYVDMAQEAEKNGNIP